MAQQATLLQEGIERVRDVYESVEDEAKRVQKQMRTRRRKLEKQIASTRKDVEKRIEKQLKTARQGLDKRTQSLRTEVAKNPVVKRLEALRKDAAKQVGDGVEALLSALQIASKSDLQRIDRKISQLNRKLKEMERQPRSAAKSGTAASASA